jgi:hypothetical protein
MLNNTGCDLKKQRSESDMRAIPIYRLSPLAYPGFFFGRGGFARNFSGVSSGFFSGEFRQEFFRGVPQIQLRAEGRENGDLGVD